MDDAPVGIHETQTAQVRAEHQELAALARGKTPEAGNGAKMAGTIQRPNRAQDNDKNMTEKPRAIIDATYFCTLLEKPPHAVNSMDGGVRGGQKPPYSI